MLAKKSNQVAIIVLDTVGSCILLKGKYCRGTMAPIVFHIIFQL